MCFLLNFQEFFRFFLIIGILEAEKGKFWIFLWFINFDLLIYFEIRDVIGGFMVKIWTPIKFYQGGFTVE